MICISDFERKLTNELNESFEKKGIAYRRKQAKYTSQVFDILVDNPYLAIECKSINYKKTKKLYFSQHFSENQIKRESEFLDKSGRDGFLVVQLRRGRGKTRKYILKEWTPIEYMVEEEINGFELDIPDWIDLDLVVRNVQKLFK